MARRVSDEESRGMKRYYQAYGFLYLDEFNDARQAGAEASQEVQEEFDRPRRTVARHTKEFRTDGLFDKNKVEISKEEAMDIVNDSFKTKEEEKCDDFAEKELESDNPSDQYQELMERLHKAEDETKSKWLKDTKHEFRNGVHEFYLMSADRPVIIPEEKLQEMKQDYSDMISNGLTYNNMQDKYGLPKMWFAEIKEILNWTHSDDIFTDDQYIKNDIEALRNMAIGRFKSQLKEGFTEDKWEVIRDNHQKWVNFEQTILNDYINNLENLEEDRDVPLLDKSSLPDKDRNFSVVLSPFDLHYGMYASEFDTNDDFDREVAEERLVDKTERLLSDIVVNGKPDKFYVGIGSDFFHVDTDKSTTTSQKVRPETDGTPGEILYEGTKLMTIYIDMLLQVAPVEIVPVPGNHDYQSTLMLLLFVDGKYENNDRVEVTNIEDGNFEKRQYREYGNNLLGFTHGKEERRSDLQSLMANRVSSEWGRCDHRLWLTGHEHHEVMKDDDGVLIYQMPALAGRDRYTYKKGYNRSRRALSACLLDKNDGIFSTMYAPVL